MSTVSYEEAPERLDDLWDKAVATKRPIIPHPEGKEDIAIISARELTGYIETAHRVSTSANTKELLEAIERGSV